MMLLAIDVGNTNTVFALYLEDTMLGEWRCQTQQARTADEYFVWLKALMDRDGLRFEVNQVVISSVVPQIVFNLRVLSDRYFKTRPLVVGKEGCALPCDVRVDQKTQVGADRLVNTVAAYERYGGNLIIVDFGTATTFDVVDYDGAYIGGVISTGVNLSLSALHDAAAALPHIDVREPDSVIGKNTVDCMQSGVFWGYIGLVEGIVARIKNEHGVPMKVIGTGGLSALFSRRTNVFNVLDYTLTMHGLFLINAYNQAQREVKS